MLLVGALSRITFSGNVGNDLRREYAIVGHSVNMSARFLTSYFVPYSFRLMKAAKEGVLVDEKTFKESQKIFKYDVLEPVKVKGSKGNLS